MLLEVRGLVARYGAVEALHGISLDVAAGEIVSLLGANGAGKSTTLKAISRVIPPSAGESFSTALVGRLARRRRAARDRARPRRSSRSFRDSRVIDNLRLGATPRKATRAEIDSRPRRVFANLPGAAQPRRRSSAGRCRAASSRCSPSRAA
jgi:branched-chain amino acid transport system ATP-binding protein